MQFIQFNIDLSNRINKQIMHENKKILTRTIHAFKTSPKSDNSLSTGKFINNNQITAMQPSTPCLVHISQFISHFCENCEYKPLCGICLQEGEHKNHSIKNSQKVGKIVHRALTEMLITTRTRSNLFGILQQHIEERRNEIKNEVKEYIELVNDNFNRLEELVKQKKAKFITEIQQFYRDQVKRREEALVKARQQNQKIDNMIDVLSDNVQKLDISFLCLFYYEKKQTLQEIVEEGSTMYEMIKSTVPDLKWNVDAKIFEQIKESIQGISIDFGEDYIGIERKSSSKGKQFKKKSSLLKLKRVQRTSNNYFTGKATGFWTPKHVESKKQIESQLKASKKMAKELQDSKKLLTLFSNDSLEKIAPKNSQSLTTLQKRCKVKPKIQKFQ